MPPAPSEPGPGPGDARRAERHRGAEPTCDLGEIVDLSTHGMRIACKGKAQLQVGEAGTVKIMAGDGAVKIPFQIAWMRRTGFRKYEMGLEFVKIGPRVVPILESLAQYGFLDTGLRKAG